MRTLPTTDQEMHAFLADYFFDLTGQKITPEEVGAAFQITDPIRAGAVYTAARIHFELWDYPSIASAPNPQAGVEDGKLILVPQHMDAVEYAAYNGKWYEKRRMPRT